MEKDENIERPGIQKHMDLQPEIIKDGYTGSGKLRGKNVLITGGDSGIGKSVAVHFAREGANIAISYLNENEDAEDTKMLVEKEGSSCYISRGDLQIYAYCDRLVDEVVSELGGIDILVNNAATQFVEDKIEDISTEHLETTFRTNIMSMIYLTKKVMPHLTNGARVINTTSVTSYKGHEKLLDYSSTKGAITSFTRALAAQLAPKNILVNAVAPGPIWTPLIPATMDDIENFGEDTPLGRCGQPSEVAPAYVYLASEDSTYVTGQIIHINGGVVVGG